MESLKQRSDINIEDFLEKVVNANTIESAKELFSFKEQTDRLQKGVELCIKQHDGQFRKSGEPYAVHPILVASIVAFMGGDDDMVISALLHDVVEDTDYTLEGVRENFGDGVSKLVEGLTKIVSIREDKLAPSTDKNTK